MTRYAVLLRGINLGRARRVAMADLRTALTADGHTGVATVLQSGNIVLDSDLDAAALSSSVERLVAARFGLSTDAIVRSHADLARIVAGNPLADVATDGSRHVVVFLADAPTGPLLPDGTDLGDDRFAPAGTELHIWCPHGLSASPLLTALGKVRNGPTATMRSWNTVRKLLAKTA